MEGQSESRAVGRGSPWSPWERPGCQPPLVAELTGHGDRLGDGSTSGHRVTPVELEGGEVTKALSILGFLFLVLGPRLLVLKITSAFRNDSWQGLGTM